MLLARVAGLFGARRHPDAELDEELRAHLELAADEHRARGLSPEQAMLAARRDLGSTIRTVERYREQRGLPLVETFVRDVRYALRLWRRAPGFAAVVVAIVALGVGVNSAMFTFVNALLLRPLPGRAAEMVGLYSHNPKEPNSYRPFSYPNYLDIRDRSDVFDDLVAYTFLMVGRPAGDVLRRAFVQVVSANYFGAVGLPLAAGRSFTREEDRPGADIPVAIASYESWRDEGFDPAFVGRTIRVNARDFTIVGVAPKGFTGTSALIAPELWLPIGVFDTVANDMFKNNGRGLGDRSNTALMVAGRLKPGISMTQANARLASLSADLARDAPADGQDRLLTVHPISRVNISSTPRADTGPAVLSAVLMPLSGGVLLIACLNIANMLLARGTARKKEIAIRLALGGGRARIVRQLLTESLVLALVGAGVGLLIGSWTIQLLVTSLTPIMPMPLRIEPRPDVNVVLAATAFAVLSALAFGLAPALKVTKPDLVDDLKDLGASRLPGRRFGTRAWLVVCQIAVSLMLMTAGGLFARGALRANHADPGYRYDGLILVSIDPSLAGYSAAQSRERLRTALERIRALPGVAAAGANSQVPFGNFHLSTLVVRPGQKPVAGREPTYTTVTADYFKAVGLPLIRGREFSRADELAGSPHVAIIDEPLARRLFPDEDPIGQQLMIPARTNQRPTAENEPMTIVGVVQGIREELLEARPVPHLYVPAATGYDAASHIHVRIAGASETDMLGAIRRELRAVDDRFPIVELRTMRDFHDRGLTLWVIRTAGRTLTALGGLALLLAAIGVYGVKSYVVSQRTREIGIRLALGASSRDIIGMLLRDGARITLVGIAIGFPLAVLLGRFLSVAMFEVSAFDPVVLTMAPLVLTTAAAIATYVPARRGTRISPIEALRMD